MIAIGMATMAKRASQCKKAIDSLYSGTVKPDHFVLWDNKIETNLYDNGKFAVLDAFGDEPNAYILLCDDDLIYPENYIETCIKAVDTYRCVITFHGRKLLRYGTDYYKGHKIYACLAKETDTVDIDVPGTGVTAFNTSYFNTKKLSLSKDVRMSDLVFGLELAKQKKRVMHIAHEKAWLKQQSVSIGIYEMETKSGAHRQAEIADEILYLKTQ